MRQIWKNFFDGRLARGIAVMVILFSFSVMFSVNASPVVLTSVVVLSCFMYGFVLPAIVYIIDRDVRPRNWRNLLKTLGGRR